MMKIERLCLAQLTPLQGGDCATSGVLSAGGCARKQGTSCRFKGIGAFLLSPCVSLRGGCASWKEFHKIDLDEMIVVT